MRVGDVIVDMNGHRVDGSADLVAALLAWRKFHGTRISVLRGGKSVVLAVD